MDKTNFDYKLGFKQYNECFAKHLLEIVYDAKFLDAEQKDKPDIWDLSSSHGIEVTTITDTYYNSLRKYKKLWASLGLTLEQIIKNQPALLQGKLGIDNRGQIILLNLNASEYTAKKSKRAITSTIEMKLKKYQNYKKFDRNDLFIFATNLHPACDEIQMLEAIKNVNLTKYDSSYDNILLFTYNKLYVFNLKQARLIDMMDVYQNDIEYADGFANVPFQELERKKNQMNNDNKEEIENNI